MLRRAASPLIVVMTFIVVGSALSVLIRAQGDVPRPGIDWPSFRGIDSTGIDETHTTPAVFSPSTARWKTPIPGLGLSSPVIWGDLLCVTTALREGSEVALKPAITAGNVTFNDDAAHEWKVICLDKRTGAVRWELEESKSGALPRLRLVVAEGLSYPVLIAPGENNPRTLSRYKQNFQELRRAFSLLAW